MARSATHSGGAEIHRHASKGLLRDRLSLSRATACWVCLLSAMFCVFSHRPLWHTDLWSHLLYGEMIWQLRAIPTAETIMPLAAGTPIIDTAWLSQLIAHGVHAVAGLAGLQLLYAACLTSVFALLLNALFRQTQSAMFSGMGLMVLAWITWWQFLVIRPQLAGSVCFLAISTLVSQRDWRRSNWLTVPLIFTLWANLHGSFVVGLVLIGSYCAGRAIDLVCRSRKLAAVIHDRRLRRWSVLLLLGGLAALLNPYGAKLYEQVLTFSQNPNLRDLTEWWALTVRNSQGKAAAIVTVALILVCRLSPRRFVTAELLPLLVLTGAMLWTSRMIAWWAPVAAYQLAVHTAAAWRTRRNRKPPTVSSPQSTRWTFVALGGMGVAIAISPIWKTGEVSEHTSHRTPVAAAEYLLEHSPNGQMFNTIEWGDYLAWTAARNDKDWQIFAASHVHLIPRNLWTDYMSIIRIRSGWEERLDEYDVETVILNHRSRRGLATLLRKSARWKVVYEDDWAVIFERDE